MQQVQIAWKTSADDNASQIMTELDRLTGRLELFDVNFGEFWAHAKVVSELFKKLRPLRGPDREALWSLFDLICQKAKSEQDRARERRVEFSNQKRGLIDSKLKEAYFCAKSSQSSSDLAQTKRLLTEALDWMKDGWGGFNLPTELAATVGGNDGRMTRADHDACWEKWREVNEILSFKRAELSGQNFDHFKSRALDAVIAADTNPHDAKERVKSIQAELRGCVMSRDQFEQVRALLDKAWKEASATQKERMRSAIARKKSLIEEKENLIGRLETQIDECRGYEANAKSDAYADTVRGWIDEKSEIVRKTLQFIGELEAQIKDIEDKLSR